MENPIKMDDLGVPLFLETPMYHIPKNKKEWQQCLSLMCSWPVFLGGGFNPNEKYGSKWIIFAGFGVKMTNIFESTT